MKVKTHPVPFPLSLFPDIPFNPFSFSFYLSFPSSLTLTLPPHPPISSSSMNLIRPGHDIPERGMEHHEKSLTLPPEVSRPEFG